MSSDLSGIYLDLIGVNQGISSIYSDISGIYSDISGIYSGIPAIYVDISGIYLDIASVFCGSSGAPVEASTNVVSIFQDLRRNFCTIFADFSSRLADWSSLCLSSKGGAIEKLNPDRGTAVNSDLRLLMGVVA